MDKGVSFCLFPTKPDVENQKKKISTHFNAVLSIYLTNLVKHWLLKPTHCVCKGLY